MSTVVLADRSRARKTGRPIDHKRGFDLRIIEKHFGLQKKLKLEAKRPRFVAFEEIQIPMSELIS